MRTYLRTLTLCSILALVGGVLAPEALAAKKVLRLRIDGAVEEAPSDTAGLMALLSSESVHTLREWVSAIDRAAADKDIAGLVLIIEEPQISLAQVEELTRAVKRFRAKDKPAYAFMDQGGEATYALAASTGNITLEENSELDITGLHAELLFFKGLLDKIGVQADMLHCGAYKSALEPFTRTEPSPEAAENVNWLLNSIYDRWVGLIADGRGLPAEEVRKLVDRAPLSAAKALDAKLVDEVGSFSAFRQKIQKDFGKDLEIVTEYPAEASESPEIDLENPFALFGLLSQLFKSGTIPTKPGVGLIYIDGAIMVGKSDPSPFGGGNTAGSTTLRALFEKAGRDESIKALVVRVDSPGGSALASDIIWKAATHCAEQKPLIVSMGSVAGSGGYYVSIPGDTVFAEPSTLTGSIGVVGGKIVWRGLMEDKLGITTTTFDRGKHAALMSPSRPWTDDERVWMQNYMNEVYEQFKNRVRASRGERLKKDMEEIAGGRVYTGAQAVDLGLVDKLGGLADALDLAAEKAGLGKEYTVHVLPRPSGLIELVNMLKKLSGEEESDDFDLKPAEQKRAAAMAGLSGLDPLVQAALPLVRELAPEQLREIVRGLENLALLQRERVGCFMPMVPQVR